MEGNIANYSSQSPKEPSSLHRRVPGSAIPRQSVSLPRLSLQKPQFKLTFTPEVPKQWRHFSIIALAALVAVIGVDSKSVPTQISAGSAEAHISRAQAVNNDVTLPNIKSIALPPVPVKKVGVKEPYLAASHVVILDDATKLPLYEKAANQRIAIASTTKVMTALVALEHYKDLDKVVTISTEARNQVGSAVGFRPGETATIRQLLYGLLLVSGNDAAWALAEQFPAQNGQTSTESFMAETNRLAKRLGMADSYFADPAGLDDINGYSTAHDMTRAMSSLVAKSLLTKIIATPEHQYTSVENFTHDLTNSTRLRTPEMFYQGIIGGKTGYTPKLAEGGAGHCLLVAAERNGHRIIVGVYDTYAQTPQASAEVARAAFDYAFNSFEWQKIAR